MNSRWLPTHLLIAVVGLALGAAAVRAEDFSVHVTEMADIDGKRALPAYTLDRLTARGGDEGSDDMPRRTYDVYLRFQKFGDVFLAQGYDEGPSKGGLYSTGQRFSGGLDDLSDVKIGWIKDSPDLCIVGWVEDHGSGNDPIPDHVLAIVQLKDERARVLGRWADSCGIRAQDVESGEPMEGRRFSWDTKAGLLVERILSSRLVKEREKEPLARSMVLGDEDTKGFWASLDETVTISYKLARGKLVAQGGTLTYKAGDTVDLAEVAAFYLEGDSREGEPEAKPFRDRGAAMKALLEANPEVAARFKSAKEGDLMTLAKGTELRIPLPEIGIIAHWGNRKIVGATMHR